MHAWPTSRTLVPGFAPPLFTHSAFTVFGSPIRNVRRLLGPAQLAILAVRQQVVLAMLSGRPINIFVAPWIDRHGFLQVWTRPLRLAFGTRHQRVESLFCARVVPGVEPVLVKRLVEGIDLGPRSLHFRF